MHGGDDEVAGRGGTTSFVALRHGQFARFFTAVTVAAIGQFLQSLAAPFLINELTDSNAWVGAAGFVVLFPGVVTTPLAGILADRFDRRKLLILAYTAQTTVTGSFALLYAADLLSPWRILLLLFLSGTFAGLQWPPIQTMPSVLVPSRILVHAVRLVSISFTAGRAVGPAVAAVVLGVWGPGVAFAATFVCFLFALAVMLPIRPHKVEPADREPFLRQFRNGVAYMLARPSMRLVLRVSFVTAALGASISASLAPAVADDIFETGGGGLGALAAVGGVGSVIGSLFVTGRGGDLPRSRLTTSAIFVYAVGIFVTGSTSWLAVGMIGYALMGVGHMVHGVTLNTSLQVQVDEQYRGRVLSVWLLAVLTGLPLGALVGGFLGQLLSIRFVLFLYGSVLLANIVWTSARTRGLALLDDQLPDFD